MQDETRAPMMVQEGEVVAVRPTGTVDCFWMTIRSPQIARQVRPGQFVMVRLTGKPFPYLGRPFSVADVDPADPDVFALAFTRVGEGTGIMAGAEPGDPVRCVGPLGNTFTVEPAPVHLFVAGGIGSAPFPFLARACAEIDPAARRVLILGGADASALHLADECRALGVEVEIGTIDGSAGFHGNVVEMLAARGGLPDGARLYACGPNPMFAALAKHLEPLGATCQAALEGHMGCGFGACNACVTPIMDAGDERWHYELICLKGPVFDIHRVLWDPDKLRNTEAEATASTG